MRVLQPAVGAPPPRTLVKRSACEAEPGGAAGRHRTHHRRHIDVLGWVGPVWAARDFNLVGKAPPDFEDIA